MTLLRMYGYGCAFLGLVFGAVSFFVRLHVGADQLIQIAVLGLIAIAVDDIRKRDKR